MPKMSTLICCTGSSNTNSSKQQMVVRDKSNDPISTHHHPLKAPTSSKNHKLNDSPVKLETYSSSPIQYRRAKIVRSSYAIRREQENAQKSKVQDDEVYYSCNEDNN